MKEDKMVVKGTKEQAIDLFASNPDIEIKKVAELLNVHRKTIENWRKDNNFHEAVLTKFNIQLNGRLGNTLLALEREALAGNVNAIKLLLEYSGKYQKNVAITVLAPYEQWLNSKGSDGNVKKAEDIHEGVEDAEIVNDMPEFKDLPPRTTKNNHLEVHKERQKLQNIAQKAKSTANRNKLRREQHKWLKRAELAGIDPLPRKRPTAGQKKTWRDSIVAKELQMKASKSKKG